VVLGNGDGSFKSARNYVPFIVSNGNFPGTSLPNPTAVTFADFNGDGKPDMAAVDAANSNVALFLNNGDGTFTELANYLAGGGQTPLMAVAADVNHDGKMDIVLSLNGGGPSQASFSVLLGDGDGTFQSPLAYSNGTGAGSDIIAVADVNGDGKLDVISDTQDTNANASFYVNLGNGDGTFQKPIATPALCPGGSNSGAVYLTVADVSGDGKPDIVAACNAALHLNTISILLGNGDGTFRSPAQFASGTTPVWPVIADFNEDGKPDVAVVDNSPTPQVSVMLGNGDGTFQSPASFSIFPDSGTGWGWPGGNAFPSPDFMVVADFNLDGHFDLLVGDYDAHQSTYNGNGSYNIGIQLFPGNGDGTLQPVQNYLAGRQGSYLAIADLDGNGSPDVGVASPADSSVNILLNQVSTPTLTPQSIAVTPATASIALGLTQQFTAIGHFADGSTQDLTRLVTWSSSGVNIEILNAAWSQGLATGLSAGGPVTIMAKLNGVTGTAQLTVTPPALQSIAVLPSTASVAAGLTQQFSAVGHYSDGSTQPLTTNVTWSSSNTNIATVGNIAGINGLASGVAAGGPVTITAKLGSISGTAQVTVTAAVLVSITISPVSPSVPIGRAQKFTAVGTYSDGSNRGITNSVTWASSSTGVATIAASGSASTKAIGTTMISATQGKVSNSTMMTVVPTCDLNGDGAFDVGDAQLIINQALGTLAPVDDLNGDSKVNVVDIQMVINGVLFLTCTL
jgi:hypothetical protein